MSSLFGGKSREERDSEKQQKEALGHYKQAEAAEYYNEMVTKALERLTRWAFPDSQVEHPDTSVWQLWHTSDEGKKYIDVAVTLQFDRDEPKTFLCSESLSAQIAELTREDLDDSLRMCICTL